MNFEKAKRVKFILEFLDEFLDLEEILFLFEKLLLRFAAHQHEAYEKIKAKNIEIRKGCKENEEQVRKNTEEIKDLEERLKTTREWIEEMENAE